MDHEVGEAQLLVPAGEVDKRVEGLQRTASVRGEAGEQDLVELRGVAADRATRLGQPLGLRAQRLDRLLGVPVSYRFGSPVVTQA